MRKDNALFKILQYGVFISLFFTFFVFKGIIFPYISSKQFSFNILIELLLPIYIILISFYPEYRPKRSLLSWGILAYLLSVIISSIFGVDLNMSFFGGSERMLGIFQLTHFFLFYLYLLSVLRSRRDWMAFFLTSVLVAFIESLIIIFSSSNIGTIGNSAFVSTYFIFNFFFLLLLFNNTKHRIYKLLYLIPFFSFIWVFAKARTSGAIIAMIISLVVLYFLLGLFSRNIRWRRVAFFSSGLALIAILFLASQYQKPWFKENDFLNRLSPNKITFQTRLYSWKAAAKDFPLHPILGTGFSNYAIIFDRQFDPGFLDYDSNEIFFDRAHNNLVDIVSTTGLLGLLSYLSIFIFLARESYLGIKSLGLKEAKGEDRRKLYDYLIIFSLIIAYFIQNLALFDIYLSYYALMPSLAYLLFLRQEKDGVLPNGEGRPWGSSFLFYLTILLVLIISLISIFSLNITPWKKYRASLEAQSLLTEKKVSLGLEKYQEAFESETVFDRDIIRMIANFFSSNGQVFSLLAPEELDNSIDFIKREAERLVAYNTLDARANMNIAILFSTIADYYEDIDNEKEALEFLERALVLAKQAMTSSPRQPNIYFIKAKLLHSLGENEEALELLEMAKDLNPRFPEPYCYLSNFNYINFQANYLDDLKTCLEGEGTNLAPELAELAIGHFRAEEDNDTLLLIYRFLAKRDLKSPKLYLELAQIEKDMGNYKESLDALNYAIDLEPSLRNDLAEELEDLLERLNF